MISTYSVGYRSVSEESMFLSLIKYPRSGDDDIEDEEEEV